MLRHQFINCFIPKYYVRILNILAPFHGKLLGSQTCNLEVLGATTALPTCYSWQSLVQLLSCPCKQPTDLPPASWEGFLTYSVELELFVPYRLSEVPENQLGKAKHTPNINKAFAFFGHIPLAASFSKASLKGLNLLSPNSDQH